ncbi:MAG: response regulator, partial [Oscillospiraceae bacterium]
MLKILIVDDEYLVRMGLCETINWHKYGFEIVAEASDGEDGYLKYLEFSPDVIITDIRMGDTSGLDLVEKVHAHNKDAEMVILSGYGQFDYAKKAYENGACAFLSKPLDNDELVGVMLN